MREEDFEALSRALSEPESSKEPIEGDGLTMRRCVGCGGLSLVMVKDGEPVAFVCPPDTALLKLAELIVNEVCALAEEKAKAKKSVIHLQ